MDINSNDMNELQRQVRELVDRSEITHLLYRLGAVLNEKRSAALRTIYTDQAVFDFQDNRDVGDLEAAIGNAKKMCGDGEGATRAACPEFLLRLRVPGKCRDQYRVACHLAT